MSRFTGLGRHTTPFAAAVCAAGCAVAPAPTAVPTPSRVEELEEVFRRDPDDVETAVFLAAAYLAVGRGPEARGVLSVARASHPRESEVALMFGLVEEGLGSASQARVHYRAYLEQDPRGPFAEEARARLDRLASADLVEEARKILAGEVRVLDPTLVAVLPFVYDVGEPELEPLALAMTELLTADIALTGRLRTLDRPSIAALLLEIAADPVARDDPGFAQRIGRLLGAGVVVYGRLRVFDGDLAQVTGNVLVLDEAGRGMLTPFGDQIPLGVIAVLQKRVGLLVYEAAGVTLLSSQRTRVLEGQYREVRAWQAFGEGIAALDADDYALAEERFRDAYSVDSGFRLARERARWARRMQGATEQPGAAGWRSAQLGLQRLRVEQVRSGLGSSQQRLLGGVGARGRAVLAELLAQDRIGGGSVLDLVLTRGGGGR